MCVNFLRLAEELKILESFSVDYLHIDIMDVHFVPTLALG
jgi:pentose-5-phosphate-3-epimerase